MRKNTSFVVYSVWRLAAVLLWWGHTNLSLSVCVCVLLSLSHKHMLLLALRLNIRSRRHKRVWLSHAAHIGQRYAKYALMHFIASTLNFSKKREATWRPRCTLARLFPSVAFFQHGLVLPGNHTVNTAGFLEVLECHSVSHQRHQLSTTKHTHTHTHTYIYSTYTHKPAA